MQSTRNTCARLLAFGLLLFLSSAVARAPVFSTECFNLFYTPPFDLANAAVGAGNAGTITRIVGTPRQIQLGAKLVF